MHTPRLEWWRDFDDPTLDALIDSALVSNLDLVEAVARVEQARAQSGIAWADLFPQVQVGADAIRTSQPANTGIGGALGGLRRRLPPRWVRASTASTLPRTRHR